MLVYHIDRSERGSGHSDLYGRELTAAERWSHINEVNCRADHQCADLMEADGRKDSFKAAEEEGFSSSYRDIRGIFYPYDSRNSITPDSNPGFRFWSGIYGSASVDDIRWEGESIQFDVRNISGTDTPPEVVNIRTETFPDAAIIRFESSRLFEGNAIVEWGRTGYGTQVRKIQAYRSGKFAILLDGLQSGNKTYNVTIRFEVDGMKGMECTISFMTKKAPSIGWPYIYMNDTVRNDDGTIPAGSAITLLVSNAADAEEIKWTFNGRPAEADGDLYYRITESGTLKAHILWPDGAEETIMKEIITEED